MVALAPPLRGGLVVTSPYGPRADGFHTGTDFRAPFGTPVYAAAAGVARRALNGGGGYGIVIDHGGGASTEYWHLSARSVGSQPVQVVAGQRIGSSGASGIVTGPHLHFEVKYGGRTVDPMTVLGGDVKTIGSGGVKGAPGQAIGERRVCYRQVADPGGGGFNTPAMKLEAVPANDDGTCPVGYPLGPFTERGPAFGIPGESGPELTGKLLGLSLDVALPVVLNVGVVIGAVLVGWGGLKKVIGG